MKPTKSFEPLAITTDCSEVDEAAAQLSIIRADCAHFTFHEFQEFSPLAVSHAQESRSALTEQPRSSSSSSCYGLTPQSSQEPVPSIGREKDHVADCSQRQQLAHVGSVNTIPPRDFLEGWEEASEAVSHGPGRSGEQHSAPACNSGGSHIARPSAPLSSEKLKTYSEEYGHLISSVAGAAGATDPGSCHIMPDAAVSCQATPREALSSADYLDRYACSGAAAVRKGALVDLSFSEQSRGWKKGSGDVYRSSMCRSVANAPPASTFKKGKRRVSKSAGMAKGSLLPPVAASHKAPPSITSGVAAGPKLQFFEGENDDRPPVLQRHIQTAPAVSRSLNLPPISVALPLLPGKLKVFCEVAGEPAKKLRLLSVGNKNL